MPKNLLVILTLATVGITSFIVLSMDKGPSVSEVDSVVSWAKQIYRENKEQGVDLSSGPCLSNALKPGWVLDLAHSPREPMDERVENQCPAYREGRAQHFVELDLDGNLIRAR